LVDRETPLILVASDPWVARQRLQSKAWRVDVGDLILHCVDFLVSLLVDRLLRPPVERLRGRRADLRLSKGRVDCALKVISRSQRGLSSRWRHVSATVSPARLELRGHWWRLFRRLAPVIVVAVRGPVRRPSGKEFWSLASGCTIVEIQTPTATLECAVLGHYLRGALEQLQAIDRDVLRETTD
jgi:hypothetical protein